MGTFNIKGLTKEALKVILAVICIVYAIKISCTPNHWEYYIDLILKIAMGLSIYIMLMAYRADDENLCYVLDFFEDCEWFHVFK